MTVIVRLKGEEGLEHLESAISETQELLIRYPGAESAEKLLTSLVAQLALFDRFPHQAEVILKEG